MLEKDKKRQRRHKRIRSKITGTAKRPRLSVYRSLNHIYGQIVNDETGKVLVSAKDIDVKVKENKDENRKVALAKEVGLLLSKKAFEKKINTVVFDRAGYKYHGRIKALAEGAREGGLKF